MSQALASQSGPVEPENANLEQAIQVVDGLSSQLSDSYEQLQQQVKRLTIELSESRHRHIRELRDKERLANRLSLLLETLPAAVIVVDSKDRIDQFNPVAELLFPEIRWGRLWNEVFSEQISAQTANNEWRLKDGRCISVSHKSLSPDPGKILVVVDVSDSRALQEQLNRQQRLAEMGEMAAQLAHQIRTPVASALLYSEHLGRHDIRKDQRKRFSERLKQSLRHTENQVKDLLSFARGGHFEPDTVNLSNLVGDIEYALEPLIESSNATLKVIDDTDGRALITGNHDALSGAISNLIENAVRHGGDNISIEVELTPVEDGYCIMIEDDGIGIEADIRQQIFDPFFTTSSDGTGLGLAVVQNVILSHGGAIRLLDKKGSEAQKGAGFVICLPRKEIENDVLKSGENHD